MRSKGRARTDGKGRRQMISGVQTLRVIAVSLALAFPLLALPAAFVAVHHIWTVEQMPWVAFILLTAVGAALLSRWLQLREPEGTSATQIAESYRNNLLGQIAVSELPGMVAFFLVLFTQPVPSAAVVIGFLASFGLVFLVAPTDRRLQQLQDEARARGVNGDVRDALDELLMWRP